MGGFSVCRFCEKRTVGCRSSCPEWAAEAAAHRADNPEKSKERLLRDYQNDKYRRRRTRRRSRD